MTADRNCGPVGPIRRIVSDCLLWMSFPEGLAAIRQAERSHKQESEYKGASRELKVLSSSLLETHKLGFAESARLTHILGPEFRETLPQQYRDKFKIRQKDIRSRILQQLEYLALDCETLELSDFSKSSAGTTGSLAQNKKHFYARASFECLLGSLLYCTESPRVKSSLTQIISNPMASQWSKSTIFTFMMKARNEE